MLKIESNHSAIEEEKKNQCLVAFALRIANKNIKNRMQILH